MNDSHAAPRNSRVLLAWVGVAIGTAYAVVAGGGSAYFGLQFTPYRVVSLILLAVALGFWLVAAVRHQFWRPRTVLWPALVAAFASLAVSTATSAQPRLGADYVAYGALLFGSYLLLVRLFDHPFIGPRLGGLTVVLSLVTSLGYIAAVLANWVYFWNLLGRFAVPPLRPFGEGIWWGNPIPVAAAVVLLALGAIAHLGWAPGRHRSASTGITILAAVAVFLTGAKAGWVAIVAATFVVGVVWLVPASNRRVARELVRSTRFAGVLALLAAVLLVVGLVFGPAILLRLEQPALDRITFAHAAIRMFAAHPITGIGTGMWTVERIRYTEPGEIDEYVPHAHNLVLQTIAELGVVGAIAGFVVIVVVLRLLLRGVRSDDALARRLAWAGLFGSVFVFIQQLTGSYTDASGLWLAYALVVARLDARMAYRPMMTSGSFTRMAAQMSVLFAGALIWLAYSEIAAVNGDRAAGAANANNWSEAIGPAREAAKLDPGMPAFQFTVGVAEAQLGNTEEALDRLRASVAVDDYPVAWLNIARLELDAGRITESRQALSEALRVGYQQPQVALAAGIMYEELGDRSAGVAALKHALIVVPTLASDPFWANTSRQEMFSQALAAAMVEAPPLSAYRLALESGQVEAAAALVQKMPADLRVIPELAVRAWAGDQPAFDTLHAKAIEDPLDVDTVLLCQRVAQLGRASAHSWVCDGAGNPHIPVLVRVQQLRTTLSPLPGADPGPHFLDVYRRNGPFRQLVPGIPQLTVLPLDV